MEDNSASIRIITSEYNCIRPTEYNNGTFLLESLLVYLNDNMKKFNINKITLQDTSTIKCGNNKISLSKLKILTSGYTWYSKPRHDIFCNKTCNNKNCIYRYHGFFPLSSSYDYKVDKYILKKINKNVEIMNKKLKYYPRILNIINKHISNTSLVKNVISSMFNYNLENPAKKFFNELLINYDKYCELFFLIYNEIFDYMELEPFENTIYFADFQKYTI